MCLAFRSDNSVGIASGLIVIMAFLGNVFTPMSGLILDIGRFTPLYGYAALARYPLTDGWIPDGPTTRCGCRSLTCSCGP